MAGAPEQIVQAELDALAASGEETGLPVVAYRIVRAVYEALGARGRTA